MILDIVVLVIILISCAIAFLRGFIREALGVVTLGLALFTAYKLGPLLLPVMEGWLGVVEGQEPEKLFGIIPMDLAAQVASRGAIFLTVLIVLSIATHILAETIKSLGMGAVDRSMGVVFGLVRAALLICVLYLPVHLLVDAETKTTWFASSKTHYYIEKGAEALATIMPEDVIKEKFDETQKSLNDNEKVQGAREKLKAMDLLREDLSPEERAQLLREKAASGELGKAFEGEGYSDEFRQKIDGLFEENAVDGNNGANQ
jgi:membrane protein required for colicin V production